MSPPDAERPGPHSPAAHQIDPHQDDRHSHGTATDRLQVLPSLGDIRWLIVGDVVSSLHTGRCTMPGCWKCDDLSATVAMLDTFWSGFVADALRDGLDLVEQSARLDGDAALELEATIELLRRPRRAR